jgi:hypothetical protein
MHGTFNGTLLGKITRAGSGWTSPTPILELSIMLATTRHVDLIRAIAGVSAIGDM